jgi:hypothetical protein
MKSLAVITLLLVGTTLGSRANAFFWGYPSTSDDMLSSVEQQEHAEQQHQGHQQPGNWKRPPAGHTHAGPGGTYVHHPGWNANFHYNYGNHPHWFHAGIRFPGFVFVGTFPAGYYQCTAFNEDLQPVTDDGPSLDEAAYAALYSCGGPDYANSGCYIPEGYCQRR